MKQRSITHARFMQEIYQATGVECAQGFSLVTRITEFYIQGLVREWRAALPHPIILFERSETITKLRETNHYLRSI